MTLYVTTYRYHTSLLRTVQAATHSFVCLHHVLLAQLDCDELLAVILSYPQGDSGENGDLGDDGADGSTGQDGKDGARGFPGRRVSADALYG